MLMQVIAGGMGVHGKLLFVRLEQPRKASDHATRLHSESEDLQKPLFVLTAAACVACK